MIDLGPDPALRVFETIPGINRIAYSPDGALRAESNVRMGVRVKDSNGAVVLDRDFSTENDKIRPTQRIRGLEFSSDGNLLMVAAADTVYAIDLATSREVWSYSAPRAFGFLIISPVHLTVSPSGLVAVAFDNGSIAVWSEDGVMLSLWHDNDSPRMLGFSPNSSSLVGTDSFSLCEWNIESRKRTSRTRLDERIYGFGSSSLTGAIATRTLSKLQIWNLAERNVLAQLPVGPGFPSIAFHRTKSLIAFGERNAVSLANESGELLARREVEGASVLALSFHPHADLLAIGCGDDQVLEWEISRI